MTGERKKESVDLRPFPPRHLWAAGEGRGCACECVCVRARVCVMASQIWVFITQRSQQPLCHGALAAGTRRDGKLRAALPGCPWLLQAKRGQDGAVRVCAGTRVQGGPGGLARKRVCGRESRRALRGPVAGSVGAPAGAGERAGGARTPGRAKSPSHRISSACLRRSWTCTADTGSVRGRPPRSPVRRRTDGSRRP
jgi:hypothetical protein